MDSVYADVERVIGLERQARMTRKARAPTLAVLTSRIKDPALAAQFAKDLASLQPASASPISRIPVSFYTSMKEVKQMPSRAVNKGQLTRARSQPNTAARQQQDGLKTLTDKYIPTTVPK